MFPRENNSQLKSASGCVQTNFEKSSPTDYNKSNRPTVQIESVVEEWHRSVDDFLQDDSEAVDVSFLSSVDRSSCQTQQLRCCPQLITVKLELALLAQTISYCDRIIRRRLRLLHSYDNNGLLILHRSFFCLWLSVLRWFYVMATCGRHVSYWLLAMHREWIQKPRHHYFTEYSPVLEVLLLTYLSTVERGICPIAALCLLQLWPFGVMWRHRSRDHWTRNIWFPISDSLKPPLYLAYSCWDIACQTFSIT